MDGSITKRDMKRKMKDGRCVVLSRYILHFRDPKTGKRKQQFFTKMKDAQRARSQLLVDIEQGTYCDRREAPTIKEIFEHWFDDRKAQVRGVHSQTWE